MRKSSMRIAASLVLMLVLSTGVGAQSASELIARGNDAYYNNDFKQAMEHYYDAEIELPESPLLQYNLAGALVGQEKYEEALDKYGKALNTEDMRQVAHTHYNMGNTQLHMQEYEKAIESYQKSLEIDPSDQDAKFNLELARKLLKEQMERQEQNPEGDQKQEQEQKQQQPTEPDENEESGEEQQQQRQQNDSEDEQQQPDQEQLQPAKDDQMSKENAERILNALRDDEQEAQKKRPQRVMGGDYRGKAW